MIWEGENVVKASRILMGDNSNSAPGTIRGDFCIGHGVGVIHGSDSVDAAIREIGLWFKEEETIKRKSH
jgi:nucleoside-diphosphate kinase